MISCRNWWPWTKPGYIPMTRRQSNNQWSGGIAAHPAPENSEFKNPLENFSPRLSGMKTASSSLIILQKAKLSRRSITHRSCTTVSRLTGHLQPRRNWPTWASNVLITYPILRVWPRRTAICSLDWKKKKLKVRHLSSNAEVIAAGETWLDGQSDIFFNDLHKLEQRTKNCIELRREYVE